MNKKVKKFKSYDNLNSYALPVLSRFDKCNFQLCLILQFLEQLLAWVSSGG